MKEYQLTKNKRCMNIHYGRSGIALCKISDNKYEMRIFIHTTPLGNNGMNFGSENWKFEHRKDFFSRKKDMDKVILDFVEKDKLYILKTIFTFKGI